MPNVIRFAAMIKTPKRRSSYRRFAAKLAAWPPEHRRRRQLARAKLLEGN